MSSRLGIRFVFLAGVLNLLSSVTAQTILFSENFDNLSLGPAVDENTVFLDFWTPTPPTGWDVDNGLMPNGGVTEWRGWSFADPRIWQDVAGDQRRSDFTRGENVIAIADPDEWDDLSRDPGRFQSFLTTPAIDVGSLGADRAVLRFDSSWRPECCDDADLLNNQTANIQVSFDGGASQELLRWESDLISPFFKDISTNELVTVDVPVPAGASQMTLTFGMTNAENDWWWAVDNLVVSDGDPTLSAEIDRTSGEIRLVNGSPADIALTGYAIQSLDGALNPSGFQPLSDGDNNWIRLSGADETQVIAEGHLSQAVIPAGAELSLGNAWGKYFREESDLAFEYLDGNNEPVEAILRFDDAVPRYAIGDFNFDGNLDALDWPILRDNYGNDFSDLLPYDAYTSGDMTRDGLTDIRDFLQFKAAYDAVNGPGAFQAMLESVPEPQSLSLVAWLGLIWAVRRHAVA